MPAVTLHPRPPLCQPLAITNPLPPLLQTPAGLALLELQGTINLPDGGSKDDEQAAGTAVVPVGRLDFPDYREDALDHSSTAWMKRVYMYIGQHQRLTGEVKKLPKPVAIIQRKTGSAAASAEQVDGEGSGSELAEELEVVEIVKYKLMFSQRPEPVGTPTTQ